MRTALRVICIAVSDANSLAIPRLDIGAPAQVVAACGVQGQLSGRGQSGRHVGKVVADRLVLPDGFAEGLALLGIRQGILRCCRGDTQRTGGDLDPTDLQAAHHLREPLAFLATEQAHGRDPEVVERQLAALNTLVAELGQIAGHGEPGPFSTSRMLTPRWTGSASGSVLHSTAMSWPWRA